MKEGVNSKQEVKKSKLAVISFIITLLSVSIIISMFTIDSLTNYQIPDFPWYIVLFLFFLGIITSIISLIFIKKYSLKGKVFAWISLIIILILISWLIILNTIESGSIPGPEPLNSCMRLSLQILSVNGPCNSNDYCDIEVKRGGGGGEFGGLIFIFKNSSGSYSNVIKYEGNIKESKSKTITLENTGIDNLILVEMTPFFTDTSGNALLCAESIKKSIDSL